MPQTSEGVYVAKYLDISPIDVIRNDGSSAREDGMEFTVFDAVTRVMCQPRPVVTM
ncbi:hypothetical protein M413DRAFT_348807 [Hebeloma cylindrosporum]|uniref:Uncharacterized protein n=1 Tax=Hebeloma cylindrosporum TaxID=76867 RepID=A0A0C3BFA3_HEBCY|nr:hypothetical protein M413DRAFT_348807 [Hebeloma cylindrosporum h7]